MSSTRAPTWLHRPGRALLAARSGRLGCGDLPAAQAGRRLSLFDDHPITWLFDPDAETLAASGTTTSSHAEWNRGWPSTYIGDLAKPSNSTRSSTSGCGPSLPSSARCGVRVCAVERFGEYPDDYWDSFPNLRSEFRGASR